MRVLIASDIFGITPELRALARRIDRAPVLVSPYGDTLPAAADEQQAYAAFQHAGGIAAYAGVLAAAIEAQRPQVLVAFSAGATAAWLALARECLPIRCAMLFYGSRIRDYLDLRPTVPARLVFAEHETACDATALVDTLRRNGADAAVMPGTRHGFMNARSPGFDEAAMRRGVRETIALLRAHAAGSDAGETVKL